MSGGSLCGLEGRHVVGERVDLVLVSLTGILEFVTPNGDRVLCGSEAAFEGKDVLGPLLVGQREDPDSRS